MYPQKTHALTVTPTRGATNEIPAPTTAVINPTPANVAPTKRTPFFTAFPIFPQSQLNAYS